MNNAHREVLRNFAYEKIVKVVNRKEEHKLYKKLVTATNLALRKKYPEKEMEVLRKYQLTTVERCVKYVFPHWSGRRI